MPTKHNKTALTPLLEAPAIKPNTGYKCVRLNHLVCTASPCPLSPYQPASPLHSHPHHKYRYKYEARAAARGESWNTEEAYKVDKGVSPAFASGGQEGREISVEVDFADSERSPSLSPTSSPHTIVYGRLV